MANLSAHFAYIWLARVKTHAISLFPGKCKVSSDHRIAHTAKTRVLIHFTALSGFTNFRNFGLSPRKLLSTEKAQKYLNAEVKTHPANSGTGSKLVTVPGNKLELNIVAGITVDAGP